jgi:hypothetical protein
MSTTIRVSNLPSGPEGIKQLVHWLIEHNPGFQGSLEDLFAKEDKAAIRTAYRRADPDTGKPQCLVGISITRFVADDKIAEEWELVI